MVQLKKICVLGGTGFVGRVLVGRLVEHGCHVSVLSRRPERHRHLRVNQGAVRVVKANVHDQRALEQYFAGMDVVINLIGILNEFHYQSFHQVHVDLPAKILQACSKLGVPKLLHMSALAADAGSGRSAYLRTKGAAEQLLHVDAGDDVMVTRFRPSVIFGAHDSFFNRFAKLLKWAPGVFPLACPASRFAPVYVGDVAEAFVRTLDDVHSDAQRYELCGPHEYSLQELVEYTASVLGLRRRIIALGNVTSQVQAALMELVPGKPFSTDNYRSLQVSSVCSDNGFDRLGIKPIALETVVPTYLDDKNQRARYDQFRRHMSREM